MVWDNAVLILGNMTSRCKLAVPWCAGRYYELLYTRRNYYTPKSDRWVIEVKYL